ncbi:alkylation response protein AidB-like acyl-CoA dehydrogenase [Caulobacter ginsengisoli]|uniref:Alkylation response protein AidB-like acyl-CoA dehydrogenase n=1 Tax=Caulobacter ginsengisoli TaxID=400775 RepID=A0ABU0IY38_9CAUL|nr:acyl-CoA dehydrogenase family protein [Caulobacter ginsengisoli]MDQ0466910.1 alkylation response protein AidB-like acyl-CoA dehydrogenase [Caulobacter ginsengisoli]
MGMETAAEQAFRQEVRAFLAEKLTPELAAAAARQAGVFADGELSRRWHRILYEQGWVAPAWPKEHGGPGWTPLQRFIFDDECARAGAPQIPVMGLQMCGPVIMRYGTAQQQAFFLPRMLSGEHYWCQGYSEPQSGSDLASLQTRAIWEGDDYVVNGTKIWTTHAQHANWMFLLVRTSVEGKAQGGISFLLTPMDAPGISVRPIISISGEHEVNQVFFDDVRIPVANRLGEENAGWTVAKHLLEFERGAGASASRLSRMLDQARIIAGRELSGEGSSLWEDDSDFRARLNALRIEVAGLAHAEAQAAAQLSAGKDIGSTASRLKLQVSTLQQRATELTLEALGAYAAPDQRGALGYGANGEPIGPAHAVTPTARYLNTRAATIYGGSSEVQRNILARALLGS